MHFPARLAKTLLCRLKKNKIYVMIAARTSMGRGSSAGNLSLWGNAR